MTVRHLVYILCAASVAHFASNAEAAVPVEESVAEERVNRTEVRRPPATRSFAAPIIEEEQPAGDNRRLSELFYQLQVLQQELQELRGMAEEQTYQLNRLARDQQKQYIDLDRRIAALRTNSPTPTVGASTPDARTFVPETPTGGPATERGAYTAAFNLMKGRQFEESATAFNQLINDYPNGQYTPNAFYWLGELYLTNVETEKARQSFVQVVNLYPDHQKVPDALYKLGVVYHRLGDTKQSLQYLNRVRSEHPQSSAAGLAESYASELR